MKNPLVSAIIPVYNTDKYIHRCIDSLINQTYSNLEIIIIDDGSFDNCPEICDEYVKRDSRIKVFHQVNKGVSEARNLGIKKSTGDWIMFIDSDDYVDSNSFSKILTQLNELNEDTYYLLSNVNKKISFSKFNKLDIIKSILNWKRKSNYLNIGVMPSVCCHLYSKKIIDKYNIFFDKQLFMGEDMIFNIEYLLHTNIVEIIQGNYYIYRDNVSSVSKRFNKELPKYDELFHDKLLKILKDNKYEDLYDIARIRSPLGGILTCCNSYFFRYPEISISNSAKELDVFVSKELYANALNNMKQVKQYLSTKQYVLLLLIKHKMYKLGYVLKNILK